MMIMSAKAIVAIGGIAYWLCYGMFKIKRGNARICSCLGVFNIIPD